MKLESRLLAVVAAALTVVMALAGAAAVAAQGSANTLELEGEAVSPPAEIGRLAWLAGYWRGDGLGGECEEMWSPPVGDRMHGIFTLRQEGEIVFSESMLLVEEAGSLVLKVKHFNPDFVGWEEKGDSVSFPLVRLGDEEAYFDGLTIRRTGSGELAIFVVLHHEGEATEHPFHFRRQAL